MNNNPSNTSSPITRKKPSWIQYSNLPKINPGSIMDAKIIKKTAKALYLDFNHYGTGLIWGAEFIKSADLIKNLKEGDVIKVRILNSENEFGMIEATLQDVPQIEINLDIKQLIDKDEVLTGKVISANRGGLLLKVGELQGFLPTSQMSEAHFPKVEGGDKEKILEHLEKLINKEIQVKILTFSPADGKIIFSERKIEEDKIKNLIHQYKVGDIIEGSLYKITSGGAIIVLKEQPLIKAFLPLTEASWSPIEKIDEIIKPNEIYRFQITSINKNNEIIVSLKNLQEDPLLQKIKQYQINQIIKGKVYKFLPFGVLIQIEPDVFGFVHSSEFGGIENMQQQLALNDEKEFIVSNINIAEKRINLRPKND